MSMKGAELQIDFVLAKVDTEKFNIQSFLAKSFKPFRPEKISLCSLIMRRSNKELSRSISTMPKDQRER